MVLGIGGRRDFFIVIAFGKRNRVKKLGKLKIFYNENKNIVDKK